MAVLATIGVIDTASITLNRWGVIGDLSCPGGADGCDKVLNSPWGTVFGQPLSLFGFLAYGAVLVMAVLPLLLKGEARTSTNGLSWWGLFLLSAGMAIFSLVLVGVMAFQIKAFCTFCLMSAAISLTLFVLSLIGGEWEDTGALLFRGVLTVLAVGLIGLGWSTSLNRPESATGPRMPIPVTSSSTPATIALADHLSATGAVMYSAYWCPHCHDQKQLFGKEATEKLTIVECAPDGRNNQAALCASKNIQGFPTWEIKGKLDSGQKSLAQLAALSGYKGSIAN
jgi:uncharacterized membrane protein